MTVSQTLASTAVPIVLRLVLGVTFLWAGLGKAFDTAVFEPEQAATLAENELIEMPTQGSDDRLDGGRVRARRVFGISLMLLNGAGGGSTAPQAPLVSADDNAESPMTDTGFEGIEGVTVEVEADQAETETRYSRTLVPSLFASGAMAAVFAWLACITEIVAGAALMLGILTRIAGFVLSVVMGTAAWLTTVGPSVIAGQAAFGFLPAGNLWDPAVLSVFLWQTALLGMCLCLVMTGAGPLSLDRVLFVNRRAISEDD
ncbi:MAG: DoxX family protein [Planctomycetota bacterium]